MNTWTIAIDFDGTVVTHAFPQVGREIGATPVLKKLVAKGHRLILWTMRSDVADPQSPSPAIYTEPGNYLTAAVQWFVEREIPLFGINHNPEQMLWTASPKAHADLYIDDRGIGTPLINGYVDWIRLEQMLEQMGIL